MRISFFCCFECEGEDNECIRLREDNECIRVTPTSFKNICKNSMEHRTRDASVRPKTVIFDTKMVLIT